MFFVEVEFEVMIDERNGRPVATAVTKLPRGTINFEVYSNERITGEVGFVLAHMGKNTGSFETRTYGYIRNMCTFLYSLQHIKKLKTALNGPILFQLI